MAASTNQALLLGPKSLLRNAVQSRPGGGGPYLDGGPKMVLVAHWRSVSLSLSTDEPTETHGSTGTGAPKAAGHVYEYLHTVEGAQAFFAFSSRQVGLQSTSKH